MANEDTLTKAPADEATGVEQTRCGRHFRPNVDILEKDDELLLLADMPGARGDRIDIQFEDGTLTIHAEVDARQGDATEYLASEYEVGDYYRTFQVSESIDASKINAEYSDGVLTLHLPKSEASKPRKIAVNG